MRSSIIFAQPSPTPTSSCMIVLQCVSVIRSVERIELPSTKLNGLGPLGSERWFVLVVTFAIHPGYIS